MESPKPACTLIMITIFNYKTPSPANDGLQMRISSEKSKAQLILLAPGDSFSTAFKPTQYLGFSWTGLWEERQRKARIPGSTVPCEICFMCFIPAWHEEITWAVPTLCHSAFEISTGEMHLILLSRKRPQLILTLCGSAEALLVARLHIGVVPKVHWQKYLKFWPCLVSYIQSVCRLGAP